MASSSLSPARVAPVVALAARYGACKEVPWFLVQPVMAALKEGATMGQAMLAAGLTALDLKVWEQLAAEGHRVWVYVMSELRVVRYQASRSATRQRKRIAESADASMSDTKSYLERILPEEYAEPPPAAAGGGPGGSGGITINILKQFPAGPAALGADGAVIDAVVVPTAPVLAPGVDPDDYPGSSIPRGADEDA